MFIFRVMFFCMIIQELLWRIQRGGGVGSLPQPSLEKVVKIG
jgi:hypothetical protein